jgi:Tfp pilus assembly protein PilV
MVIREHSKQAGVTLIETIIGVAIMVMIAFAVYQGFAILFDILGTSEARVQASALANEELEIIRNMPYSQVGTVGGVPNGVLTAVKTKTKGIITFTITTTVRNVDDPYDGTLGGAPNDLSPADYKIAEVRLICVGCSDPSEFRFSTRVAPKALETSSTNGALFIRAIDSNGQAVAGAIVQVIKTSAPAINITDTTDVSGYLKIIDAPPGVQAYHIIVSKSGYSSDQTYLPSPENPNPSKIDSTVAVQTVTQITFTIDPIATINATSLTNTCATVPSINFEITGAELIGTSPNVPKFTSTFITDSGGIKTVSNLEPDTYTFSFSNTNHDLAGTIPLTPLSLASGASQNLKLVMAAKNPRALMVTVKDSATGLPLSDATVQLSGQGFDGILTTGRGFWNQTDWSEGSGQDLYVNTAQYFSQDGNIDTQSPTGEAKLMLSGENYMPSGSLISSTFNTGSASNFYSITWNPGSQPPDTGTDSLKFQIATATTTTPMDWTFLGPDGTSGTYYTTANTNINTVHNGDQYIRYQAFLSTASTTFTPNVSDVAITFASDCVPPGQVFFSGLLSGSYSISISWSGYQTINDTISMGSQWQEYVAEMNP